MKIFTLLLLLLVGCSSKEPTPIEKGLPVKTHPAPRHDRPRRMLAYNKTIIVAVLDTGFGYRNAGKNAKLCKYGHRNFTDDKATAKGFKTVTPVPKDFHGHGTNIVGIIDSYAGWTSEDYCVVISKTFSTSDKNPDHLAATLKGIRYAINIKADFINYSGGGYFQSKKEVELVSEFIDRGGKFIAAAGNDNKDLETSPYYPAQDDYRVYTVGSLQYTGGPKAKSSNYGKPIDIWEVGENMSGFGIVLSGTSQATAVVTGKMVKSKIESRK